MHGVQAIGKRWELRGSLSIYRITGFCTVPAPFEGSSENCQLECQTHPPCSLKLCCGYPSVILFFFFPRSEGIIGSRLRRGGENRHCSQFYCECGRFKRKDLYLSEVCCFCKNIDGHHEWLPFQTSRGTFERYTQDALNVSDIHE